MILTIGRRENSPLEVAEVLEPLLVADDINMLALLELQMLRSRLFCHESRRDQLCGHRGSSRMLVARIGVKSRWNIHIPA
jgi:hypothetical protein